MLDGHILYYFKYLSITINLFKYHRSPKFFKSLLHLHLLDPFTLMEPDWAYLPAPALRLTLDKLVELVDHVRFGAVCKNWCSIAKPNHQHHGFETKEQRLPMLMIPTKRKSRKERSLYSISEKSVYPFRLHLPYSRRCCGSSYGWIATVDRRNIITLFNPFKNVAPIILPPIKRVSTWDDTFYERNIHKVTLSADPTTTCPNDYVVATVHNQCCHLAFIKAGQEFWTYVDYDLKCFSDITFYKGLVYAVGRWEGIVSFDLCYSNDPTGNETIVPNILSPQVVGGSYSKRAYLVKSLQGELWMVRRFLGYPEDEDDHRYSSVLRVSKCISWNWMLKVGSFCIGWNSKVWETMFCLWVTTIQYLCRLHISLAACKRIQFTTPMTLIPNQ